MKECRICKTMKPLSEYGKEAATKDGLNTRCKVCVRERFRIYRINNPEKTSKKSKRDSAKYKKKREQLIKYNDLYERALSKIQATLRGYFMMQQKYNKELFELRDKINDILDETGETFNKVNDLRSSPVIWCRDCGLEAETLEEEEDGLEIECDVCPTCGGELTDEECED